MQRLWCGWIIFKTALVAEGLIVRPEAEGKNRSGSCEFGEFWSSSSEPLYFTSSPVINRTAGPVIKTPREPFNSADSAPAKMNLIEHPITLDITYFFLGVVTRQGLGRRAAIAEREMEKARSYKYTYRGKSFPLRKPNVGKLFRLNEC